MVLQRELANAAGGHQLRLEPLCEICLEADRVTPATVADSNHTEATTTPSGSARSAASARPAMMASTVAIARPFARVLRYAPMARRAIRDIRGMQVARYFLVRFSRMSLMSFQPQPLRPHALYFLIKFVNFFIELLVLRFWIVAAAQLFKRLLNREFGCFSHVDLTSSFLTIHLRRRGPGGRPLFFLTRSSAI